MLRRLFDLMPAEGRRRLRLHSRFHCAFAAMMPDAANDADPDVLRLPPPVSVAEQRRQALREAFTPTRPQRSARRFVGRAEQFDRIMRALEDERAHVVLYAERGHGKTSLANLVAAEARHAGHMVARVTCSAESDYDAIIRGLARDIPVPLLAVPLVDDPELEGCETALPPKRLQPRDVVTLPQRLTGARLILIVDEFDRVLDEETRTRLADTIKQASDACAPLSFVIVGVSDSLEHLLGRHPSIQRNVVGVPLPLLAEAQIEDIIARGAAEAALSFPADARSCIAGLARGVPYVAHVLALRTCQAALERDASVVGGRDLRDAIACAVRETDPRVIGIYETVTAGGRDSEMTQLLRTIAGGRQNAFGQFLARPIPGDGVRVAGGVAHRALWTRLLHAGVIRPCVRAEADLFTFGEAMFGHYVLLRDVLRHFRSDRPAPDAGEG